MTEQHRFDLIIVGHHSESTTEALAQSIVNLLEDPSPNLRLKLTDGLPKAERIILCEGLPIQQALALQKSLSRLLVKAEIREQGSDKPKAHLDATKQARLEETMRLREAARRQLHLVPDPDKFLKVIAGMAVAIILLASLGLGYYFNDSPTTPAQPSSTTLAAQAGAAGSAGKPEMAIAPPIKPATPVELAKARAAATNTDSMAAKPEAVTSIETAQTAQNSEQLATLDTAAKPVTRKDPAVYEFQMPSKKSVKALRTIEDVQQLQPQLGAASSVFDSDRQHLKQALERNDRAFVKALIDSSSKPYSQSLLLLELVQLENEQQQPQQAQAAMDDMRKLLAETRDIDQQVLILGALNKGYLILNERAKAEASLKQAIAKASDVPKRSFQTLSLMQLANEQALLGNVANAQKLLKITEPLLESSMIDQPKAAKLSQVIAIYALMADFAEAKSRLPTISDQAKREALSEWVSDLENETH